MVAWLSKLWRSPAPMKTAQQQAKIPMVDEPRGPRKFSWVRARDPEIYPLLACVATGVTLLGIYLVHNFTENPDVNIRRDRRETPSFARPGVEHEAHEFTKYRAKLAHVRPNPVNTDKSFTEEQVEDC